MMQNYIIEENIDAYEIASLLYEDEDIEFENFVNFNLEENNVETYLLENLDVETLIIE